MMGFNWFYIIVSQNFTRWVNRPALLFILVPLLETELAENITLVTELPEKKINPTTAYTGYMFKYCCTFISILLSGFKSWVA